MAPFVGLDPDQMMDDITTFDLYRSRIPTPLFKSIVQDMDILLSQYGPPYEHETEAATSLFFAPVGKIELTLLLRRNSDCCSQIFNRLVDQFRFAFRNVPEPIQAILNDGRVLTPMRGNIAYHFKAFGSIAVLFIQVKLKIGGRKERMDAIAQVIAECDGQEVLSITIALVLTIYSCRSLLLEQHTKRAERACIWHPLRRERVPIFLV